MSAIRAVVAGALVLASLAVGAVVMWLQGPEMVVQAGVWGYAALAASALTTFVAALLIAFSRRSEILAASGVLILALPLGVALVGSELDFRNVSEALVHVADADRATILVASTSERILVTFLTAIFVGVAWLFASVSVLVTAASSRLPPRIGLATASALMGASALLLAWHVRAISETFRATAMVAPVDRVTLLVQGVLESEWSRRLSLGLTAAALLTTVVATITVKKHPVASVALLMAGLSAVVALTGLSVRVNALEFAVPTSNGHGLVFEVFGPVVERPEAVTWLDDGPPAREGPLWVAATKSLERETLEALMAANVGQPFMLVGESVGLVPPECPEKVRDFVRLLGARQQWVPLEVRWATQHCDDCVGRARLVGESLEVTLNEMSPTSWHVQPTDNWPEQRPTLDFEWVGGVEQLVAAANIASTHGHALSLGVRRR